MIKYCANCGTKVEPSWNTCPNCGNPIEHDVIPQPPPQQTPQYYPQPPPQQYPQYYPQPPPQQYPQYYQHRKGNTNGVLALIFGIIGLCCCGFIFGLIAIILGAIGLSKDDEPAMATIGLILGIIDFVCGIILLFFWLLLF